MKEVGTLKELDVKPGDVVECVRGKVYADTGYKYTVNAEYKVNGRKIENINSSLFRIISRANTPKLWRDMTDAEKGALLLAFHNDKKCLEIWRNGKWVDCGDFTWNNNIAYRIRPEPKVEVVTVYGSCNVPTVWGGYHFDDNTHRITFTTIDGKPDTSSIKMEAI